MAIFMVHLDGFSVFQWNSGLQYTFHIIRSHSECKTPGLKKPKWQALTKFKFLKESLARQGAHFFYILLTERSQSDLLPCAVLPLSSIQCLGTIILEREEKKKQAIMENSNTFNILLEQRKSSDKSHSPYPSRSGMYTLEKEKYF